jgi:hypothetical protein
MSCRNNSSSSNYKVIGSTSPNYEFNTVPKLGHATFVSGDVVEDDITCEYNMFGTLNIGGFNSDCAGAKPEDYQD